jgi:hypothetical protein
MTDPLPPGADDDTDDEDAIAQLLLADAMAEPSAEPGMGEPQQPDMGDPMTTPNQPPAQPATGAPSAQPATDPPSPSPQSQPQPPAQPAMGAPAGSGKTYATGANGEDLGYPLHTPVAEMTAKEEAAYWRHKARLHEDRWKGVADYDAVKDKAAQYDRLVATQQTEHEKAVAAARAEGRADALQQAGGQVVDFAVRAAAAGRMSKEAVDGLLGHLDRSRFVDSVTGAVDADKVYQFIGSIAPTPVASADPTAGTPTGQPGVAAPGAGALGTPSTATPPRGPDFGQGQPSSSRPTGLAAGAEIARQRFAKTGGKPQQQ